MAHISEYEVENLFIDRLESIGYEFVELRDYHDVVANFRRQLAAFNAEKLTEAKGEASFSDAEFGRVMIHVDNHSVYESAKILRDKYVLQLDNGKSVYLDFFGSDVDRNIYQVTHQVTMDKAHKDDVVYKNRYDVTILINGLPIVQIELKRPGVEINEARSTGTASSRSRACSATCSCSWCLTPCRRSTSAMRTRWTAARTTRF